MLPQLAQQGHVTKVSAADANRNNARRCRPSFFLSSPSAGAKPLRIMRVTRLLLRLLQAIARGAANKALEAHRRVQTQESASQVSTALYNAHDYTARYATGLGKELVTRCVGTQREARRRVESASYSPTHFYFRPRLLMDSHQDNSAVLASMVEDLQNLAVASAWPAARLMLFNLVSQLVR